MLQSSIVILVLLLTLLFHVFRFSASPNAFEMTKCFVFILLNVIFMANLEQTSKYCPWDLMICIANRSDEGNQTNDAVWCKMAHGINPLVIKKNTYIFIHPQQPQFWGHLVLEPSLTVYPLILVYCDKCSIHSKPTVNHFFTSCFRSCCLSKLDNIECTIQPTICFICSVYYYHWFVFIHLNCLDI